MVTSVAVINTAMVTSSSIPGNAASPEPCRLSQAATHYVICGTLAAGVQREAGRGVLWALVNLRQAVSRDQGKFDSRELRMSDNGRVHPAMYVPSGTHRVSQLAGLTIGSSDRRVASSVSPCIR